MAPSKRYITCLTIAGSDSGGGAGIQADLKTFFALGVFGTSVITSVTAQNTCGVRGVEPLSGKIVGAQIDAVLSDIVVDAIKIGMLHSPEAVEAVIIALEKYAPKIVILDPVMIATSGDRLIQEETIDLIIKRLLHQATIVTPNVDEASLLSGISITNEETLLQAADILLQKGCKAVLMKGGHLEGETMSDILCLPQREPLYFSTPKIETRNTHGTGCTLSSAIAAYMAQGNDLATAVGLAKNYIQQALLQGAEVVIGNGHGPLNHNFAPLPYLKIDQP